MVTETEMEQLLNMGFSQDQATQALAATGGKCTLKATEWILNSSSSSKSLPLTNPNPNNPYSSSSPPVQHKLDHFFPSSKSQSSPKNEESTSNSKRTKLFHSSTSSPQQFPPPSTQKEKPLPPPPPQEPLAERMRPKGIDDVIGQDHLLGKNSILRTSLNSERLPSIVLWGPPGTGKTSIARAIAFSASNSYRFVSLSAVTAGVKDVRESVDEARKFKKRNKRTVLFIDEVHRFNKAQQDSFLPVIEDGSIVFIGATTENPSFHLITPLLSRCRVFTLNALQPENIVTLLKRAANDSEKGLVKSVGVNVRVEEEAFDFVSLNCDGDARVALNALEISATIAAARVKGDDEEKAAKGGDQDNGISVVVIDGENEVGSNSKSDVAVVSVDDTKEAFQCKHLAYDKDGEEHYNLISALHKSMRGSDANAAIYWLARMLEGGEEPLYIARRLIRFASEDVGLADPTALNQAVACYQSCQFIGMPECGVVLAQCVAYLALAPKSVAVYQAIGAAQKMVRESAGQNEGVPLHLRNAPTKLMKQIGYGKGYIYPPNDPAASSLQTYLPPSLQGYTFLNWPGQNRKFNR